MDLTSPFAESLGLEFTAAKDGYSRCVLELADEHRNSSGLCHGGVLYTMADTGMGVAVYSALDDEDFATIEAKISYLRPVRGDSVTCETTVLRRGGSVIHLESELTAGEQVVARATGTYAVLEG